MDLLPRLCPFSEGGSVSPGLWVWLPIYPSFICVSACLSTYDPSLHLPIHPSTSPSFHVYIYLCMCLSVCLCVYPSAHLWVCPYIHPSTRPSNRPPAHFSTPSFLSPSIRPLTNALISLPIHLCIPHLYTNLSIIHLCVYLPIYLYICIHLFRDLTTYQHLGISGPQIT